METLPFVEYTAVLYLPWSVDAAMRGTITPMIDIMLIIIERLLEEKTN